jgi:hypothetical protein
MARTAESFALPSAGLPADPGAVSWGAVFAGAAGAAALSLILILLGTGIGLAVVSPWAGDGASAEAIGVSTIVWITVVQALASVLGGYLAGRLRTRWLTVNSDEVFFRDTAHGFLAWAVATLLMASLLSSAITSSISAGLKAGGAVVATAAPAAAAAMPEGAQANPIDYFADTLLRSTQAVATTAGPPASPPAPVNGDAPIDTAEIARIFTQSLASGQLDADDTQYLSQAVAARTGLSPADAQQRVTATFARFKGSVDDAAAKAKAAADEARKASAYTALWLVVSLLIGAFLASLAATFGGKLRDSSELART